jgi:hypothetical protein
MEDIMHFVEFDKYCKTCKHKNSDSQEDPCDECLGSPARENSRKPINYKEAEIK